MFLWFQDIEREDYTIVGYRSLRLSFGLRCSPAILMLALFKILILDKDSQEKVNELKQAVYNNMYMDNGAYTTTNSENLR